MGIKELLEEMDPEELKEIEKEWINNNFKISRDRVQEIIKLHSI